MRGPSPNDRRPAGYAGGLLRLVFAVAAVALLAGGVRAAEADLRVEGEADAVHLDVRGVPLRQVLDALVDRFELSYRSNDALDTPRTGRFSGPLRRVAARLLEGYDFAIKIGPHRIDVLILRQDGRGEMPAPLARLGREPVRWPGPVLTAQQANRYERANAR
jgi:hypothetical protein